MNVKYSFQNLIKIIIVISTSILFYVECNLFNSSEIDKKFNISEILFINEFLASNSTILSDEYGEYDDWVEIYNSSDQTVDIGGMFIWGDPEDTIPYQIPDSDPYLTSIAPKSFLLLWFDRESEQGILHIENKLSKDGTCSEEEIEYIISSLSFMNETTDMFRTKFNIEGIKAEINEAENLSKEQIDREIIIAEKRQKKEIYKAISKLFEFIAYSKHDPILLIIESCDAISKASCDISTKLSSHSSILQRDEEYHPNIPAFIKVNWPYETSRK